VASPPVYVGKSHRSADEGVGQDNSLPHHQASDPKGFSYLKRDLVRLLGILTADCRSVQERVRICGGITVVLNLCVIDDRNPCKSYLLFLIRMRCQDHFDARLRSLFFFWILFSTMPNGYVYPILTFDPLPLAQIYASTQFSHFVICYMTIRRIRLW
jgi:hypothetical protein